MENTILPSDQIGQCIIQEGPKSSWKILAPWQARLVETNLGLIYKLAHDRQRGANKLHANTDDFDELVGAGQLGLVHAAATFDKTRHMKFSTYACTCIINEFNDMLRKSKWIKEYRGKKDLGKPANHPHYNSHNILALAEMPAERDSNLPDLESIYAIAKEILKPDEFTALKGRIETNDSYKTIGIRMGCTRQYVEWLTKQATRKLKAHYADHS